MDCDAKCVVISGSIENIRQFLYWSNLWYNSI